MSDGGALHASFGLLVTEAQPHPAQEGQMLLSHADHVQMWGEGEDRRGAVLGRHLLSQSYGSPRGRY